MPHIHEKIDFTAEVFIVYENKVLLRKHDKYNIWLSVGGHIELDEDPNQAAIREVKEEVGLDIELYYDNAYALTQSDDFRGLIPPCFMNRHRINDTHEHVSLVYFARTKTDELIISKTEKSSACKWFTKEEIISCAQDKEFGLTKDVKIYALAALETIK